MLDELHRLVHEAVDAGITFFDARWKFRRGKTEALVPVTEADPGADRATSGGITFGR